MDTIIFDVDDTLYDQALSFHTTFRKLIGDHFSYKDIHQIYRASRHYSEMLFDQSERGEITVFDWQIGRIIRACEDFEIPLDQEKATTFHHFYAREQANIKLFPEVIELFDLLKQSSKQLAILTNGETDHQSMKIKQLQLNQWVLSKHIYISGSYGYAKPKKEIFKIVEEELACNPNETVYVGDSYEKDIIGAKQAGWKAVWFNHRNREVPKNSRWYADKEVHSAKELLAYFQKLDSLQC